MGRDPDLMEHLGHIGLQVLLHVRRLIQIWLYPPHASVVAGSSSPYPSPADPAYLIQHHIPAERLHYVVIGSQTERVLGHILAAGSRYHNERRSSLHLAVVPDPLHHGNPIQSRHDHIHEDNIRICSDDHIVCVLAIICFSNHMESIFLFQNVAK